MDKNIKSSLDELIAKIEESKEFKNYKEAKSTWEGAKESQKLLDKFFETRNTVRIFQQGNFPGLEEQQELLKTLYKQVTTNSEIKNWNDAQAEYQQFIWDMATYLSKATDLDFAPEPKGGCC